MNKENTQGLSEAEKAHLKRPVLVVFTKNNRILQAGDPAVASARELAKYAKDGCRIKTMTLAAYQKLPNKWAYED